jgi:hypothetical protein
MSAHLIRSASPGSPLPHRQLHQGGADRRYAVDVPATVPSGLTLWGSSTPAVLAPNGRRSTPLADHEGHTGIKVDITDLQVGQLGEPHARVEEQADHGRVPTVVPLSREFSQDL